MTIERPMFPPRAEPSRDLAYCRLEDRINDLDRLCEVTTNLVREMCENPEDHRWAELATTIAEVTQDRMREFRTIYYDWYKSPPREGDDYVVIPNCTSRR